MNFYEWFQSLSEEKQRDILDCSKVECMSIAYEAAKEDSKQVVEIYFQECYHGGVDFSYYALTNLKSSDKKWHFKNKQQAKDWALQNGYRVVE